MKSKNSLKWWLDSRAAELALLTEIITRALTQLICVENRGIENSATRFQAGLGLGLIPCRTCASAWRSTTHRLPRHPLP